MSDDFPTLNAALKAGFARRCARRCAVLALFAAGACAHAITITVDYSLDTTGFFAGNAAARNAVNAAANDISLAILPSLGAVADDFYSGTSGGTTATMDWSLNYKHPVTDLPITLTDFAFNADTITIYAGMRPLSGSTLGQGGPGGAGIQVGLGGNPAQYQAAVNAAAANSDAAMKREAGGLNGPIIGSLSGNIGGANYTVGYGPMVGQMSFDNDTDNNGSIDSAATLAASWHFDHTTNVAAGKNDLYSVALHELLHSIGIGTADSWELLVSGTTWNGANAKALNGGSGLNLIAGTGDHIASGFMSVRYFDGVGQEVVMDPSITTGTRKYLTQMDLAFLKDVGYATVPEPSTAVLLGFGALALSCRQRARK